MHLKSTPHLQACRCLWSSSLCLPNVAEAYSAEAVVDDNGAKNNPYAVTLYDLDTFEFKFFNQSPFDYPTSMFGICYREGFQEQLHVVSDALEVEVTRLEKEVEPMYFFGTQRTPLFPSYVPLFSFRCLLTFQH